MKCAALRVTTTLDAPKIGVIVDGDTGYGGPSGRRVTWTTDGGSSVYVLTAGKNTSKGWRITCVTGGMGRKGL